jgi:ribosomal protein L40E
MGYLVCDKCGGYYELKPGESASDFEECSCGGKLRYAENIGGVDPKFKQMNRVCLKCGAKNPADVAFCSECGVELKKKPDEPQTSSKGMMGWWDKQEKGTKAAFGLGGVCCIGLFIILTQRICCFKSRVVLD